MRSQIHQFVFCHENHKTILSHNLGGEPLNHPALVPLHKHLRVHLLPFPRFSESESVMNPTEGKSWISFLIKLIILVFRCQKNRVAGVSSMSISAFRALPVPVSPEEKRAAKRRREEIVAQMERDMP